MFTFVTFEENEDDIENTPFIWYYIGSIKGITVSNIIYIII